MACSEGLNEYGGNSLTYSCCAGDMSVVFCQRRRQFSRWRLAGESMAIDALAKCRTNLGRQRIVSYVLLVLVCHGQILHDSFRESLVVTHIDTNSLRV